MFALANIFSYQSLRAPTCVFDRASPAHTYIERRHERRQGILLYYLLVHYLRHSMNHYQLLIKDVSVCNLRQCEPGYRINPILGKNASNDDVQTEKLSQSFSVLARCFIKCRVRSAADNHDTIHNSELGCSRPWWRGYSSVIAVSIERNMTQRRRIRTIS
jgi:hypothetical protein